MEGPHELSSKAMIFTILPAQSKGCNAMQCNAAFMRLTRQCYHCETTWQCYSLTMLKTILEDKEVNAIVLIG